jgi:hypothetical protein
MDRKEVITMQMLPWLALGLAHDAQQREIERLARERRASSAQRSRRSIRSAIGRRVIAFGQRIAADPSPELARSR